MTPNIKQPLQSLNEQAHFFWPHIYIHTAIWKRISWNTTLQSSELDLSVKAMVETRLHSKPMLVTWSFWFSSLNWFLPSKKSQYMTKESYSCLPQRQENQLFYPCHFVSCLEHWVTLLDFTLLKHPPQQQHLVMDVSVEPFLRRPCCKSQTQTAGWHCKYLACWNMPSCGQLVADLHLSLLWLMSGRPS